MKKSKRALVPKLRFPEFRDAGEWEERPLGKMCNRIVEKVGETQLTPVSISAGNGFLSQVERFGRVISGAQYKKYIRLHRGDFAYNKGNSKSYPQGCVMRLMEFDEAAAPNAYISFRLHEGYIPEFFEGLFEMNIHGRQLIKYITSSARSDGLLNINSKNFFKVTLPLPPTIKEQQKIADCLASLDDLITAEAEQLEALKAHKKGLMQQLFPREGETTPRLRFPEFEGAGEWEEKAISVLGEIITGSTPSTRHSEYYGGDRQFVSPADISEFRFIRETKTTLTEYGFQQTRPIKPKSVLFVCIGSTIGKVAQNLEECATNQQINSVIAGPGTSADFLYYLLSECSERIAEIAGNQAVPIINKSLFSGFKVLCPQEDEQRRIADCLSSLDELIAAQAAKIETLKTHKKGLMQQLFPCQEVLK